MFAVVESGSITSMPKGNKGIQIGDIKYPSDIFTAKWTESQRNAIEFRRAKRAGGIFGVFLKIWRGFWENQKGNANEYLQAKRAGKIFGVFSQCLEIFLRNTKEIQRK